MSKDQTVDECGCCNIDCDQCYVPCKGGCGTFVYCIYDLCPSCEKAQEAEVDNDG